jgi:phage-related baseplate assembly protein
VVDANVIESSGTVDVYIWNGTGSTSSDLVDLCQTILDGFVNEDGVFVQGYRCAGVITNVSAASEITQNIAATLTIEDGFDSTTVKQNVEDAVNDYFDSLGVGDDILYTQLITVAQNEDGVVDVNYTTPPTDVTINFDEVAVIGTVTLT